jgi:hypothetical protein
MKKISKHIKITERQNERIERQMAGCGMTFVDWIRNAIEVKLSQVETVDAIGQAKQDLLRTQNDLRKELANLRLNLLADQKSFIEKAEQVADAMSERHIKIAQQHISGMTTVLNRGLESGALHIGSPSSSSSRSSHSSGGSQVSFPSGDKS